MANSFTYVPYKDTGYFSRLVTDYISGQADIMPFSMYPPDETGLDKAIEDRCKFPVNRQTLVAALTKQYAGLEKSEKTQENIQLLLKENTFTICTAHQPNLLTGYLYFIYKILHAIKLAEQLNDKHPDQHFVPVFYMGSEDNDIEELGTFRFRGEKYVWDGDSQHGAVGRMSTKGLKTLLDELFKTFGPPGKNCDDLQKLITDAYLQHATIGAATQYLVNELFGRYGLIVIDPDDAMLKSGFIPVMEDELLDQHSFPIIANQIQKLSTHYKIQANPREINLFYLTDQLRERIEKKGDKWITVNTNIEWSAPEILKELKQHPERFSPNVMLRGLYQEMLLPNIAFIGGGAEVAYWLQLTSLFAHYEVFYPCILLRQSVQWIGDKESKLRSQLDLSIADTFKPGEVLVHDFISKHVTEDWHTGKEMENIETIFQNIAQKATGIDATLAASAEASLTRMKYQLTVLEQKMLRAVKKKNDIHIQRIARLKKNMFPYNNLQERVENFMEYYLEYGPAFFDIIKDGIKPGESVFLVIEEKPA